MTGRLQKQWEPEDSAPAHRFYFKRPVYFYPPSHHSPVTRLSPCDVTELEGEGSVIPHLQMGEQSQRSDTAGEQQAQESELLIRGEQGGPGLC